jgi:signal transduction histidine kinase
VLEVLRASAVGVQIAAVLAAVFLLEMPIPLVPLVCAIAVYVLLAVLVPWFGVRIGEIRLQRKLDLRLAAEKDARERYLLGLATLAAGTAHEMGTPLSTMSVIVGDLRRSDTPPPDWQESMEVLWQQIQACKGSLSGLAEAADSPGIGSSRDVLARRLVHSLVERIHLLRPGVSERLGGAATMFDSEDGGIRAQVELPALRKVA